MQRGINWLRVEASNNYNKRLMKFSGLGDQELSGEIYEKPALHYYVFYYDFLLPKMVAMVEVRK